MSIGFLLFGSQKPMVKSFKEFLEAVQYGDFRYVHACPDSTYEDISDMTDKSVDISRRTFIKYVNQEDRQELERSLGYGRDFPISGDWHVSYSKSEYRGSPCVYLTWSAIEHIFTLNGKCGTSLAPDVPEKASDWKSRYVARWQAKNAMELPED